MRRLAAVLLLLALTGCQLQRPGEIRPKRIPGCEAVPMTLAYTPLDSLSEHDLAELTYCRTAEAAEAAKATESNTDFTADMTYLSVLLGLASAVLTGIVAASSGS